VAHTVIQVYSYIVILRNYKESGVETGSAHPAALQNTSFKEIPQ
jgi:hypothetical protein